VIAFGSPVSGAEAFRRYAEPGIRLASEPDSELFAFAAVDPAPRTYNLILEAAAAREDLEALVLVHPHTEIVDPDLLSTIREALSDPEVAVVGCAGASAVSSMAWWEGAVTAAPGAQRYGEHGGGELPAFAWSEPAPPPAEVEVVDGQLFALSPWAVRNVRFDESLIFSHGFDVDFSLQVRAAGRKLVVADLRAVHHRSLELVKDLDLWAEAHMRVAEKWDQTFRGGPTEEEGWKRRARYAEAEREAARAIAFSKSLKLDARVLELEREFDETTSSASWRLTAPLRMFNRWRRGAAERLLRS
jgi:hypothetical protein